MSTSSSPVLQDAVADTLLIPLAMRYHEARHPQPILVDPMAKTIVEELGCDVNRFKGKRNSQVGVAIRVRHFDNLVRRFVEKHDDPVVVSIGCGLDTRFQRVDTGKGMFYELDLPEVIDLREKVIPSSERNPYIAMSMFEDDWMDSLRRRHPASQFCLVAEGVLLYFEEHLVRELVLQMVRKLAPGELIFDVVSTWGARNSHRHDTVKDSRTVFKWGLDDDRQLEYWSPSLRHLSTATYFSQERRRWGMLGVMSCFIPRLNKHSRMLQYEILA
jgi:methyltransferase (TIGR00027 family)